MTRGMNERRRNKRESVERIVSQIIHLVEEGEEDIDERMKKSTIAKQLLLLLRTEKM